MRLVPRTFEDDVNMEARAVWDGYHCLMLKKTLHIMFIVIPHELRCFLYI